MNFISNKKKAAFMAAGIVGTIYGGFAISTLWGWFIVPLGVVPITIPWAIGINCIAGIIKGRTIKVPTEQDLPHIIQITMIYVGITVYLIGGYICHRFI